MNLKERFAQQETTRRQATRHALQPARDALEALRALHNPRHCSISLPQRGAPVLGFFSSNDFQDDTLGAFTRKGRWWIGSMPLAPHCAVPLRLTGGRKTPDDVWGGVTVQSADIDAGHTEFPNEIRYRVLWDDEHTLGARIAQGRLIELCGSAGP